MMNTKTIRYIMYTVIIIFCIVAIGIAVYAQFFVKEPVQDAYGNDITAGGNIVTTQDINQSFLDLFTNEFYGNYDGNNITKLDNDKEIVYTFYSENQTVEGKYSMNINIPVINIQSDVVTEFNNLTQSIFVDKINAIMSGNGVYTIYNLNYTSYINNNILSLAIKATIKEGDNPQRVIVQTYNYNLETNEKVTVKDILEDRDIDETVVENRIKTVVQNAINDANKMAESGYTVYQRDINDEMYQIDNVANFMEGPNGELYIIFAYGNNNYTSEMDIIEI